MTLSAVVTSTIIEQRGHDPKKLRLACELNPINWRLCLRSANLDLDQDRVDEAHATLTKILLNWPDNYVALRLATVAALKIGHLDEAKTYQRRYLQLFPATSWRVEELNKKPIDSGP